MTAVVILASRVVFQQVYTCSKCQSKGVGTPVTTEEQGAVDPHALSSVPLTAYHMPMFWGHYGNGDFRCPACT